jgi:hypothetical protein
VSDSSGPISVVYVRPVVRHEAAVGRSRSLLQTSLLLIGLALLVRLGVLITATAVGPADSVGDVAFHMQLVDDPVGHLRASTPEVSQYAPYLGVLEWATAKPWLAAGASDVTALRLSSVTWDLLAMALLLFATAKRFPRSLVLVGLLWAASPLVWPASAYSAQDETIGAAIIAGVVVLLFARRRYAAIALCAVALFTAKILLAPILLAILLTAPKQTRSRSLLVALATVLAAGAVTWMLSGTDGLSQQAGYSTDVLGFSISGWSTLVLHRYLAPATAIRVSVIFACAGLAACVAVWWQHRDEAILESSRLAAALSFTAFALLAVSNPEYLCIAAPVAIVACIGLERVLQSWLLVGVATLAWAINAVYYLLRKAYDPTGSVLGITGIDRPVGARVRFYDVTHQALLALFLLATIFLVRNYLIGHRSRSSGRDEEPSIVERSV